MALADAEAHAGRAVSERNRERRRERDVLQTEDADADARDAERVARHDTLTVYGDEGRVVEAVAREDALQGIDELQWSRKHQISALRTDLKLLSLLGAKRQFVEVDVDRAGKIEREAAPPTERGG